MICNSRPFRAKFADNYSEANTIMLDDLGRNFVMNPQNGRLAWHAMGGFFHIAVMTLPEKHLPVSSNN